MLGDAIVIVILHLGIERSSLTRRGGTVIRIVIGRMHRGSAYDFRGVSCAVPYFEGIYCSLQIFLLDYITSVRWVYISGRKTRDTTFELPSGILEIQLPVSPHPSMFVKDD